MKNKEREREIFTLIDLFLDFMDMNFMRVDGMGFINKYIHSYNWIIYINVYSDDKQTDLLQFKTLGKI